MTMRLKSMLRVLFRSLSRGAGQEGQGSMAASCHVRIGDADRSGFYPLIVGDLTPDHERGEW